jgi:hypothetical protein
MQINNPSINRIFNNSPYFKTEESINQFKNLVLNKEQPEKYKDFVINNNRLIYLPTNQEVLYPDEKEEKIKEIYEQYGLGSGQNNLYEKVSRRYLGISRKMVTDFLNKQSNYQMVTKPLKQTNKRIYSNGNNKTFYVDLIDMNPYVSKNKGYRYIMTVVDAFSKFVMLVALKNKDSKTICDGLNEAVLVRGNNIYPKCLISDNGLEFANEDVKNFCIRYGIKQVFGRTHSPKSNALAEITNKLVREGLRVACLKNANLKWINYLQTVANSINDTKASSTSYPRSQVFLENKHHDSIHANNLKEKKEDEKKTNNVELKIGDKVRVSLSAIDTKIRAKQKSGEGKYIIAHFSTIPFTITKIFKSRSKFTRDMYQITDPNGYQYPNKIYYNELRKIPENTVGNPQLTVARVNELNQVRS